MQKKVYVRPCPKQGSYVLDSAFSVFPDWIDIPKGFRWKGTAGGVLLWKLVGSPFKPQHMRASMTRDFLYYRKDVSGICNDRLFYKVLVEDGTPKRVALVMFLWVRARRLFIK